jgi:endo-1,4-beta-D-glucanase Y
MKKIVMFLFSISLCISLSAQKRPFPQNVNYGFGYRPTSISNPTVQCNYNNWKKTYLKECGTTKLRVEFNNPTGTTVSEGQGYGMVISAYMGDSVTFNKLYAFEKSMHNQFGNMGWKVDCNGFIASVGGSTSATDGDLDITFSLCIAAVQWGKNYAQLAKDRINVLKKNNFTYNTAAKRWIQEWGDGTTATFGNTSYWCPGYYRVFKDFTGDAAWDQIATDTYALLLATRNATTGFNGNEVNVNSTSKSDVVDYNGARSPWRYVLDYLWTGNVDAKNLVDKMTDWANAKGITKVLDGYKVDGTPTSSWNQSPAWTGAWACGAMAKSQAVVNTFTANFNTCTFDEYFASSLRLLYQLVLTGNYWEPALSQVTTSKQFIKDSTINIYPNPVKKNGKLTIKMDKTSNKAIKIQIFTLQGTEIYKTASVSQNGYYEIELNGSISSGVYFLEIQNGKDLTNGKLIVN